MSIVPVAISPPSRCPTSHPISLSNQTPHFAVQSVPPYRCPISPPSRCPSCSIQSVALSVVTQSPLPLSNQFPRCPIRPPISSNQPPPPVVQSVLPLVVQSAPPRCPISPPSRCPISPHSRSPPSHFVVQSVLSNQLPPPVQPVLPLVVQSAPPRVVQSPPSRCPISPHSRCPNSPPISLSNQSPPLSTQPPYRCTQSPQSPSHDFLNYFPSSRDHPGILHRSLEDIWHTFQKPKHVKIHKHIGFLEFLAYYFYYSDL